MTILSDTALGTACFLLTLTLLRGGPPSVVYVTNNLVQK